MSPDDALLYRRMCGMEMFYHGQFDEARSDLQFVFDNSGKATRGSDVLRFQFDQTAMACVNLSKVLWLQGLSEQASRLIVQGLDAAKAVDHDLSVTYVLAFGACRTSINTGDFTAAENHIDQLFERAAIDRAGPWRYFGQCWKGVLLCRQGYAEEAAETLADALVGIPDGSFGMHHTRFLGELAYALAKAGHVRSGQAAMAKAVAICQRLDERWYLAELLRLEGEIVVLEGGASHELSRKSFMQALSLARRQGALSLELRAATSLVRHGSPSRKEENSAVLNEVYGRFVEGFDTVDLRNARALLDAPSG